MGHSSLKNGFCYTPALLFSHFLILFGSCFPPFGLFRLTPMTDGNEDASPAPDVVVKPEEPEDEKVGSLT